MTFHKVVWSEGMFIHPQHFQQQDRYFERLVVDHNNALTNYNWGLLSCKLDHNLLRTGQIAFMHCSGILPDGTAFNVPAVDEAPMFFIVPPNVHNQLVYLALPLSRAGQVEVALNEHGLVRYKAKEFEIMDAASPDMNNVNIHLAQLNFRVLLESDDRRPFTCLPVARIREVTSDNKIILDDEYIPPCLDYKASNKLVEYMREILALLNHRAEILTQAVRDIQRSNSAIGQFLLLQLINRMYPLLVHMQQKEKLHPESLYCELIQLAGELATFATSEKRLIKIEPYKHQDLENCFKSLMQTLRNELSFVIQQDAIELTLKEHHYGILVATLPDHSLLDTASFVLAVNAALPSEEILSRFPAQAKLGAVERIQQLIAAQLPGIKLLPLPVAPPQIPYHTGCHYFKLDISADEHVQLKSSAGIALHVSGHFADLKLELWAIREN